MKTGTTEHSNKLAKHVSDMQNNDNLWLHKHTHMFITIINFIAASCALYSGIYSFANDDLLFAAFCSALFLSCASDFMQKGIYYTIELPPRRSNKLFKIGDVYFVGANMQEAELYAHIENLEGKIECIDGKCDMF